MAYPYPLHRVSGDKAVATLYRLREASSGFPVIHGDGESFERLVEAMEYVESTPEELIAGSLAIEPLQWLAQRRDADPEYYEEEHADWPEDARANATLISHLDILSGEPLQEVVISIVPAAQSWQVPCYLKTGGWNECPGPAEHAALFRYWQHKYEATVACVTSDVIEMQVGRPPTTREEALILAREQYVYCPDIVQQGVETIEALAATVLNAKVWYFWWD